MGLSLVNGVPPPALDGVARQEELLDALARLLASQVGEHPLPDELGLRVHAIECELGILDAHPESSL